jgi:hypothetical protein
MFLHSPAVHANDNAALSSAAQVAIELTLRLPGEAEAARARLRDKIEQLRRSSPLARARGGRILAADRGPGSVMSRKAPALV